jgi:predicted dehydrogenase
MRLTERDLTTVDAAGERTVAAAVDPILEADRAFVAAVRSGTADGVAVPYEEALRTHRVATAAAAAAAAGWEPMGELTVEGIYPLGYVRALAGAEVRRVFARTAAHFHQRNVDHGVEDLASVTLELEGGLLATLAIGRIGAASHHSDGEISLRVLGSAGALIAAEARPEVGVYYRGQPPGEARQRRLANHYEHVLAEDFARAIDAGGETALDARASRRIFATVAAALESARSGQPVDVRP